MTDQNKMLIDKALSAYINFEMTKIELIALIDKVIEKEKNN